MSISIGKNVPVLIKCQSQHCHWKDILKALDLPPIALFDGKPTPEIRRRVSLQEQKDKLHERLEFIYVMQLFDTRKPLRYWQAAERRVKDELMLLRYQTEPEEMELRAWRKAFLSDMNRLGGWAAVRKEYMADPIGREILAMLFGRNAKSIHSKPPPCAQGVAFKVFGAEVCNTVGAAGGITEEIRKWLGRK